MGVLPILQKNSNQRACLGNKNLPANYMSDYSVMGLVVDRLDAALGILKEKKFEIQKKTAGFEITIDGAGRISEIVSLLQQNGIDYAMTDTVDQVYQG
ncbi:MAG: hypothetical protein V2I56_09050 [Desulfobacteraceae bacterium]|jgi:hypothetical protein|nr:hypothetical protein [Desulfobacteraceae bacterium]